MQDVITREIKIKAPKERVYKAITDPKQIIQWFPSAVEGGTLAVGARPIFHFDSLTTQIYVEAANPFDYFAYRWVPGDAAILGDVLAVANTLVEFFIEELPEGTKVILKESGFASLPAEIAQASFKDNDGGWDLMMGRLEQYLGKE